MRIGKIYLILACALSFGLSSEVSAQSEANPQRCVAVDKREKFDEDQVAQDVASFDANKDQQFTEDEYRAYLRACDRLVLAKPDAVKESFIEEAIDELIVSRQPECGESDEDCQFGQRTLYVVQRFSVERDRDLFVAFKPKPAKIERTVKLERSIMDAASPLAKDAVAKGPFLVSYKRDYAKKEDAGLLLGKISYGPWFWGKDQQWDGSMGATLDINTGKKREESTVGIGATATYTRTFGDGSGGIVASITPEYGTDGNGDRDVVTLRTQVGVLGKRFLGAGQWTDLGSGHFAWDPSLTLYCGEVRDDGGNAALAKIALQGSYCRAQPGLEMRWRTNRMAKYAFGVRLGYGQTYDLQDDWDRGYGELEATMGVKDSPLQLIILYRKGRKAPAFEDEKALIFGVGIQL